jgi:LacI family transcriptional regulator
MGFQPNAAARSLASGMSGTVALVIPKASHLYVDAFLAQLVATINDACHKHGLRMLIESTDEEVARVGGYMSLVRERSIDGLIIANPKLEERMHLEQVHAAKIPLVVLAATPDLFPGIEAISTDASSSAKKAVNHLIGLGHARIAFISFAPPEYYAANEREQGWREALNEAGVEASTDLLEYANISAQSGYEAMQRLLKRGVKFSALFAGNDTIAFGAMRALVDAGLRVPNDVAIVGYDDVPLAEFANPPLTTVRSDPVGQANAAFELLLTQLKQSPGVAAIAQRVRLPPELVIRSSCGFRE